MVEGNVKVWNDNVHDFSQVFKGDRITIKAGEYIEMDYWEAKSFLGKGSPILRDAAGVPRPESFKKLRIEGKPSAFETVQAFKCHADGTLHATKEALDEYVRAKFSDRIAEESVREEIVKNKGGRPKKQAQEAANV